MRVTPASLAWRFGCLVAACVVCRLVFQFSGQLGLLFAVVVALWVPGLALAKVTGLTARVYTSELLGLAPLTGLVAWTPLFFVALVVHMPFQWVVVLVLVASALALSWDPRPLRAQIPWEPVGILTGSFLFTGISTRYVPSIWGDALFHAGLIRKLLALPGISISGVSPYHNGHAHAGYAFPILHAVQAGAMSITGGDATLNYQNLTPAFAPMIPIAAYALGRSVANSPVGLAAALITCWDVMSFPPELSLAKQPPYFTLLIIFPAVMIILNYVYRDMVGRYWWVWTIVGAVIVGLLHDTTSVILLPLILAAVLLRPRAWPALAGSIAVTLVIFAAVYVIAIRGGMQVVRSPGLVSQWITFRGHHIASSGLVILGHRPEVLFGMIASAVILFRRQSPYRLPAAMVMTTLAVVAIPGVGLVLSHAIAGGQVARYTKVPPAIYVTAIVIGLTANWLRARRRRDLWAAAGAVSLASILISRWDWIWAKGRIVYGTAPGHYISGEHVRGSLGVFTGADLAVFAVMAAGGIGLIYCVLDRDRSLRSLGPVPSWGAVLGLVLALLIGSVVRHDQGSVASVLRHGSYKAPKVNELSAGLLQFFHNHEKAPFPVVMAPYWAPPDEGISYQLVGRTTVYTVALPQDHTRATPRDHPARRRGLAISFFNPHTPEATRRRILRAQDVDYVVLPIKSRSPLRLRQLESDPYMHKVYEDPVNVPVWSGRFVIFRFNPGTAH